MTLRQIEGLFSTELRHHLAVVARENERLKDRVQELEDALGLNAGRLHKIRAALKVEPLPAQAIGMLLEREIVTRESLYIAMYSGRTGEPPCSRMTDQIMFRARRALRLHDVEIAHLD